MKKEFATDYTTLTDKADSFQTAMLQSVPSVKSVVFSLLHWWNFGAKTEQLPAL